MLKNIFYNIIRDSIIFPSIRFLRNQLFIYSVKLLRKRYLLIILKINIYLERIFITITHQIHLVRTIHVRKSKETETITFKWLERIGNIMKRSERRIRCNS